MKHLTIEHSPKLSNGSADGKIILKRGGGAGEARALIAIVWFCAWPFLPVSVSRHIMDHQPMVLYYLDDGDVTVVGWHWLSQIIKV